LVNQHISFFFYRASQSNFLFEDSYLWNCWHLNQILDHFNEKDFGFLWKEVGSKSPSSKVLFTQDLTPQWKNLEILLLHLIIAFCFPSKFLHTIYPFFQLLYSINIIQFLNDFFFDSHQKWKKEFFGIYTYNLAVKVVLWQEKEAFY